MHLYNRRWRWDVEVQEHESDDKHGCILENCRSGLKVGYPHGGRSRDCGGGVVEHRGEEFCVDRCEGSGKEICGLGIEDCGEKEFKTGGVGNEDKRGFGRSDNMA